jgi:hypothetical protein
MLFDPLVLRASRNELASLLNTCGGLVYLMNSFIRRKQDSFLKSFRGINENNNWEAWIEHERAMSDLQRLSIEVKVISGIIEAILLLFDHKSLHLNCITPNCPIEQSMMLAKLSRLEKDDDMIHLPESICSSELLHEELIKLLDPQIRLQVRVNIRVRVTVRFA